MANTGWDVDTVLDPVRLAKRLVLVIAALALAHLAVLYLQHGLGYTTAKGFIPMFHLGGELNVPAFFSSLLLLAGSLGFYALYRLRRPERGRDGHWLVLACLFAFLALDEWASLHEMWVRPVRQTFDTSGIFYYAWVIPYGIGVVALGIYVLPRLLRLPKEPRTLFFLAAGIYLFGAMGMEFVEGYLAGTRSWIVALAVLIEETFEMLGLVTLFLAQARLLLADAPGIRVRFEPGPLG